jgi:hypothetical protein
MSEPAVRLVRLAGIGVGAPLALPWRARREQSLAIELEPNASLTRIPRPADVEREPTDAGPELP